MSQLLEMQDLVKDRPFEEAFSFLSTDNLCLALTFMFIVKGWKHSIFCEKTLLSHSTFYRIINNEFNTLPRALLFPIVYCLDPGGIIGEKLFCWEVMYAHY